MAENYNMDALFHPKVDLGNAQTKNSIDYSPSADKGQNGVYKAIIRFVSWWNDPEHSISDKWVCWLVDPITNRGRYVDCPSSIGKPSPLQDMFFKLRKSESIQERKKSEIFSRRHSFSAVVQVIKDDQNKEAEGKLMIWKFGKKIWEKIEAEKKPLIGEPHEAFDLLDGKAFAVVVTKVSGYNNYDQSKFLDKKIPLLLPLNTDGNVDPKGTLTPINEKTLRETVFNFLKEHSPDLRKYAFKEWDQETHDYVNQVIVAVTGQVPSNAYGDIVNKQTSQISLDSPSDTPKQVPTDSGITSTDLSLEELNIDSGLDSIPNLDLPDLNISKDSSLGIGGDLDAALNSI